MARQCVADKWRSLTVVIAVSDGLQSEYYIRQHVVKQQGAARVA